MLLKIFWVITWRHFLVRDQKIMPGNSPEDFKQQYRPNPSFEVFATI
jgi:hypothetical protein